MSHEKLYVQNDVDEFYSERITLDSEPDRIWAYFESWCADRNCDPTDPASFERYLDTR